MAGGGCSLEVPGQSPGQRPPIRRDKRTNPAHYTLPSHNMATKIALIYTLRIRINLRRPTN